MRMRDKDRGTINESDSAERTWVEDMKAANIIGRGDI
jgi:hypothetical protein